MLLQSRYAPDYAVVSLIELGFDAGTTVVFDFPGGGDIEAFSGSVDVPSDLVLLTPDLMGGNYAYVEGATVNVQWKPAETASNVDDNSTSNVWVVLWGTNGVTAPLGIVGRPRLRDGIDLHRGGWRVIPSLLSRL